MMGRYTWTRFFLGGAAALLLVATAACDRGGGNASANASASKTGGLGGLFGGGGNQIVSNQQGSNGGTTPPPPPPPANSSGDAGGKPASDQTPPQQTPPQTTQRDNFDRRVRIVNDSGQRISLIYGSPVSQQTWGNDRIPTTVLQEGGSLVVDFNDNNGECSYDLRAVFADGSSRERRGVNICQVGEWRVTADSSEVR